LAKIRRRVLALSYKKEGQVGMRCGAWGENFLRGAKVLRETRRRKEVGGVGQPDNGLLGQEEKAGHLFLPRMGCGAESLAKEIKKRL